MQRHIEAPDKMFLSADEARDWLRGQGLDLSVRLWNDMLLSGFVRGVREVNRQTLAIHWRGVVMVLWALELGHLPGGDEGEQRGKARGA
jgi:hypothetical protein